MIPVLSRHSQTPLWSWVLQILIRYITGRKFAGKSTSSITEAESIESALRLLRSTGKWRSRWVL